MKSSKLLRANRLRLLSIAPSERGMPRTQPASAPQNGFKLPVRWPDESSVWLFPRSASHHASCNMDYRMHTCQAGRSHQCWLQDCKYPVPTQPGPPSRQGELPLVPSKSFTRTPRHQGTRNKTCGTRYQSQASHCA